MRYKIDNSKMEEIKHHLQDFLKESEKNEQLYIRLSVLICRFSSFLKCNC